MHVMLDQALLSLPGTAGIKDLKRQTCDSQANTNVTYLPSDCGGLVKQEFQQSLIAFSCEPDAGPLDWGEMIGFANSSRSLLPWHTILDIQTKLPPPTDCAKEFLWRGGGDPFGLELSLRFTKADRSRPRKASIREAAAWPRGCSSWVILTPQPRARVVCPSEQLLH